MSLLLIMLGSLSVANADAPMNHATPRLRPFSVIAERSLVSNSAMALQVPGYTPAAIRAQLGLTPEQNGRGTTIAIVTAYDDPNIETELMLFSRSLELPTICGSGFRGDCFQFTRLQPQGRPEVRAAWAREAALDVEWAHAIAPLATIVLVQAISSDPNRLAEALEFAARQPGVAVISNSWGGDASSTRFDEACTLERAVCVFASGDSGMLGGATIQTETVAHAPHALSVGGTTLRLDAQGGTLDETAWVHSTGGVSAAYAPPAYQAAAIPRAGRTIPDVAFNADPETGLAVFFIPPTPGLRSGTWSMGGGTSAGTPVWAALIAIADQFRTAPLSGAQFQPQTALYAAAGTPAIFDVTSGRNGTCAQCAAEPGYDLATGLGSPRAGILRALIDAR